MLICSSQAREYEEGEEKVNCRSKKLKSQLITGRNSARAVSNTSRGPGGRGLGCPVVGKKGSPFLRT